MKNLSNGMLVVSVLTTGAALAFLLTGELVPYPLVRNGVYTCAAALGIFAVSLVVSYWVDLSGYKIQSGRSRSDLKQRVISALFILAGACFLLRMWELQEDRELLEAREAYDSGDYQLAKELFIQQRKRFWTTDDSYVKVSNAVRATEASRKWRALVEERVLYPRGDAKRMSISRQMDQLKRTIKLYPYSEK